MDSTIALELLAVALIMFSLVAESVTIFILSGKVRRLRARQHRLQAFAQSLGEQVIQMRAELHLMQYDLQGLMSAARAQASSPSAKMRAQRVAEQEQATIEQLRTQRLPRWPTRPLDPPEQ